MSTEPSQEEAIFNAALELDTPEQRLAYIRRTCGADAGLLNSVEALLQAYEESGGFLNEPVARGAPFQGKSTIESKTAAVASLAEHPGQRIGRYKLLEKIGEGGFGDVWMAEQGEPVHRRVALKIIKLGMDTKEVVARFEAERQALAMLDHANIARIFDGGATESGRPYFVMELVRGVKITDYCDQAQLSPQQRLELFIQVCHAVQHAHQKGLIHRDLKPSNILISVDDAGVPMPKIIDFGITKAVGGRLTDKTLFTRFHEFVGTPAYMSPEQAALTTLDVDTRSDIYSLGVLLYELLTGRTPFETREVLAAGLDALRRTICEQEPLRPSTRLGTLSKEELTTAARQRHCEALKLMSTIRGDLDWIVMRCLEKDRARRYQTVQGLANDVGRHLRNVPVEAGPPSWVYRTKKFVVRHRGGVMAAAAMLVLLVAGLVSSLGLAGWANRERKEARQAQASAEAVLEFFQEKVLAAARPTGQEGGLGREVTLRAVLEAAEPAIPAGFSNQPLVEASIRQVFGTTFHYLGEPERAITHHRRSVDLRARYLGKDRLETVSALNWLAEDLRLAGQAEQAIPLLEQAVDSARRLWGPTHTNTLSLMNDLVLNYFDAGRVDDSIKLFEETLRLRRLHLGLDDPDTMVSLANLGDKYRAVGREQEGLPLLEQALVLARKFRPPGHPDTLVIMNNLGLAYSAVGEFARAEAVHQQVLTNRQQLLGSNHLFTIGSMANLAVTWRELGRFQDSFALLRKAAQACEVLETNDPYRIAIQQYLALASGDCGHTNEALRLLEEIFNQRSLRPDHPDTLRTMNHLARARLRNGQVVDAQNLMREAERRWRAKVAGDRALGALTLANLAECLLALGSHVEMEGVAKEYTQMAANTRLRRWCKPQAAALLGAALLGQGRLDEAEPELRAAFDGLEAVYTRVPAYIAPELRTFTGERLAQLWEARGRRDLAEQLRRRAVAPPRNSH